MIERAPAGESVTSTVGQQRFFNQASVRILLSDTQSQITSLPAVTSAAPYPLAELGSTGMGTCTGFLTPPCVISHTAGGNYYLPTPDSCHPPMAESPGWTVDNDYMYTAGTTLLGGYIKVEIQLNSSPGTWQDVTQEVLSTGISRDVYTGGGCTNISILHLERAKPFYTEGAPTVAVGTGAAGSLTNGTTYYYIVVPIVAAGAIPGTEAPGVKATATKKMNLTWSAYPGATGYYVYRGTSSGGENGYLNVGNVLSYTDSGLGLTAGAFPTTPPASPLISAAAATTATNFVPINIYDPREGEVRDITGPTTASMNGVMNLLEVDVGHLQKWLNGTLCTAATVPTSCPSGALALGAPVAPTGNGEIILYISDRRGNCNQVAAGPCTGGDTGQYGYEDTINPASGTGTPNGALDTGEDVNGNGALDAYGGTARPLNCANIDNSGAINFPAGSTTVLSPRTAGCTFPAGSFMDLLTNPAAPTAAPLTRITSAGVGLGSIEAQVNPVLFFRHAVRLVDGSLGNLPPYAAATMATCPNMESPAAYPAQGGFSVATENPLYILGDYNALTTNANGFTKDLAGQCHVPAAVFADAVTLLSDNWVDGTDLAYPTNVGSRPATSTDTWFRVAVIAGKNMSFPLPTFTVPAAPPNDFGTDGGTHNFLRYIEKWNSTLNYLGAMVSFYYAVQATGIYKCCNTVYGAPTRSYGYDTDFTNITSLPPGTPRFTDVNALSYQQSVLATQ
jgi:hypothetical protein